jgi:hypothetical protein
VAAIAGAAVSHADLELTAMVLAVQFIERHR